MGLLSRVIGTVVEAVCDASTVVSHVAKPLGKFGVDCARIGYDTGKALGHTGAELMKDAAKGVAQGAKMLVKDD